MKLNPQRKNDLPKSVFALPEERKFPMPDRKHAANAKARATQGLKAGTLSQADAKKIRAKAKKVLSEG